MVVIAIHLLGDFFIYLLINVSNVPAKPNPNNAVLITREPKFDQFPIEKTRITNIS